MFARNHTEPYEWVRLPAPAGRGRQHDADRGASEFALPAGAELELHHIETVSSATTRRFSLDRAMEMIGVPNNAALTPEAELVDLLCNAAEIEHGLMLQYLYASYSATDAQIAGRLRQIAIEEMGHFVSVQNLLIACGAAPYLGHSDWDDKKLFYPYAFRLERLSLGVLAKFTIGEMPDPNIVPDEIRGDLPEIERQADQAAGGSVEAHRVGLLYSKIYWLLRETDLPLQNPADEQWKGFPVAKMAATSDLAGRHVREGFVSDASKTNALPEHWKGNFSSVIVKVISGRAAALDGIAQISAQGEGFEGGLDAHFERFVEAWRSARNAATIALPVATNPYYGAEKPAGGGDQISEAVGVLCAKMGDALYELVLLCMAANLLLPSATAPELRRTAAQAALSAMKDGLREVAAILKNVPIADPNPSGTLCGLPFSVSPISVAPTIDAVLDRADAVIAELHALADQIEQNATNQSATFMAQGVAIILEEDISPGLQSLRP